MEQATQLDSFWYIVARSHQLGGRPLERRVNGRRLVLFRTAGGKAAALDARCPHRGASLAEGSLRDGCVSCPYHGWAFDGDGRCVSIPSEPPERPIPAGFATRAYPVAEQQGFVWVRVGAEASAPPPTFAELDDPGLRAFHYEDALPLPFDWWVENTLDVAHVPFVHRSTYGGQNPVIENYAVQRREDALGFTAATVTRQRYSLIARLLHRSASHFEMRIRVTHLMPGSTVFDIDLGGGKRQVLLFFATPEDGQGTRIWVTVLRNYLKVPFGDWIGRRFLRAVIREDVRAARASVTQVSLAMSRRLSVAADEPSVEFLRLLRLWQKREESPHE